MKRKWDFLLGSIGGVLSLIFIGGFAVTMQQLTPEEFQKIYQTTFSKNLSEHSIVETQHQMNQLAGYFVLALFFSLIGLAAALFLSNRGKHLLIATSLYGVSGLILLLGTQFIAYPIAFFHFVACGFMYYRYLLLRKEENSYVSSKD